MYDKITVDEFAARMRKDSGWGYEEPPPESADQHVQRMTACLIDTIQYTFGAAGMRAIKQADPLFFKRVVAIVREAYLDGHHQGAGDAVIEAGRKANRRSHQLMLAALTGAMEGEDKGEVAVRMIKVMAHPEED